MPKVSQWKQRVLDSFENREDWHYAEFERVVSATKPGGNGSYHDSKSLILEAHKVGQWPKVVERYLMTNFSTMGTACLSIFNDIYNCMTPERKEYWKSQKK